MQNLEAVIKLVKKLCVEDRQFKAECDHHTIINHTLEQQGVQRVLGVIQRLSEGDENLKEIMKTL